MNYTSLVDNHTFRFLKSAFAIEGSFMPTRQVVDWMTEQNQKVNVKVKKIRFDQLDKWKLKGGSIKHDSDKFFSIDGIRVETNWSNINQWDQPIINQNEIGYLGFITKEFNGILYFLVQSKIEPGNVNYVQLSPTLQATRSNYSQIHNGKKPLYLEYFLNAKPSEILLDQLQSEQGARFLRKRNRNIIIMLDDSIPVYDNFVWLTLGQIKQLMRYDNLVNMDTRTVISGIPFGSFDLEVINFFNFLGCEKKENFYQKAFLRSALTSAFSLYTIENIITFLTQLKSTYDLEIRKLPLNELENWIFSETVIFHKEQKFFKVIAVDVEIESREVVKWSQPMIEPAQEGLCVFICKEINGLLHLAVQAKLECGNHDIIEFAPTVQCLTGNYRDTKKGTLPFLDYVLRIKPEQIVFDTLQSEEGGRFFREQNRNMIVIAGDEIPLELPNNYIWMTLNQLNTFLKFNNYLNIQSRSLIAAISFI